MKLSEFWDVLNSHDWTFEFSDDFSVYRRGKESLDHIKNIASMSRFHYALYEDFYVHIFKSDGFKQFPKPEKPND